MSSTSDSVSFSSSSSGSMRSREDIGRPPEEGSSWPVKVGYDWVAADVRNQSSLF